jgi:Phage integrase family
MSRRKGQNPKVRLGKRADGSKYFYFQYWSDVAGKEERKRMTVVLGMADQLRKREAERKKLDFVSKLKLNSDEYRIPSSAIFADAAKNYREDVAPRVLRPSTISVVDGRIKNHLETDWKDVPVEHITIDSVNKWAAKKRLSDVSWVTIKDALRTMQRVLSSFSEDKKRPFSLKDLEIHKQDKLQMQIRSRDSVSFSWVQAEQISAHIQTMEDLGDTRREQYAMVILLVAASGLRAIEVLALRGNDIDFKAGTIRVDESSDQRSNGALGPCKNAAAYRTIVFADIEGLKAMQALRRFLRSSVPDELVFRSGRGNRF